MLAPAIPSNESDRLASLNALQILDTPREERFERIVKLTAEVMQVPIAYIALIDSDRQWFKAKIGLQVIQTPRSSSFCGHTILRKEPLIIEDAILDERFHDNPMVVGEPFIRFYAGFPLASEDGYNIGTLCIADKAPRKLTERDMRILKLISEIAERGLRLVDLVHSQHQLLTVKNQLIEAQEQLNEELVEAASYVRSLLPEPLELPVRTDWEFITSSALGGDLFGYHWLDEDRLAIYLLDVMGHGVGAALLSASIYSMLSNGHFTEDELDNPSGVLTSLNRAFPMSKNGGRFFTIWYGVYNRRTRQLKYANAGHPPALIFRGPNKIGELCATGTIIGIDPNSKFDTAEWGIPQNSRLYLYSDGLTELDGYNGLILSSNDLAQFITQHSNPHAAKTSEIVAAVQTKYGLTKFKDDVSLLEVGFG